MAGVAAQNSTLGTLYMSGKEIGFSRGITKLTYQEDAIVHILLLLLTILNQ